MLSLIDMGIDVSRVILLLASHFECNALSGRVEPTSTVKVTSWDVTPMHSLRSAQKILQNSSY